MSYRVLERYCYAPDCTLGRMGRYCTIEPPWKDNEPYVSCIPDGVYRVEPHHSPRFGKCFILTDEEAGVGKTEGDRTHILFHPANWADQLQGCIAPGMSRAYTSDRGPMVLQSQDAMQRMLAEETEPFMLDIRPHPGACLTG